MTYLKQTGRAWLATLMIGIFYVVDIGGSVALTVLFFKWSEQGAGHNVAACVSLFAACQLIFSLFPIPRIRLKKLGVPLRPEEHPELFERIASVAMATDSPMPATVILSTSGVMVRGRMCGRWGMGGRDFLVIGLPVFLALKVSQFEALLAQQFLCRRHRLLMVADVHQKPMGLLSCSLLGWPVEWYLRKFQRCVYEVVSRDEQAADRLAAERYGSDVLISGLCEISRLRGIPTDYYVFDIGASADQGFLLSMAEGLSSLMTAPAEIAKMDRALQESLKEPEAVLAGFGRRLSSRIADVKSLAAARHRDERLASVLLPGISAVEFALVQHCVGRKKLTPLKRIAWTDLGPVARVAAWQRIVAAHAERLDAIRLGDVYKISQRSEAFATLLTKGRWSRSLLRAAFPPSRSDFITTQILGSALACRMCAIGWIPSSTPLERKLAYGEREFNPFVTIDALIHGKLSQQDWEARIDSLGLFRSMSLGPIEFSINTNAAESNQSTCR